MDVTQTLTYVCWQISLIFFSGYMNLLSLASKEIPQSLSLCFPSVKLTMQCRKNHKWTQHLQKEGRFLLIFSTSTAFHADIWHVCRELCYASFSHCEPVGIFYLEKNNEIYFHKWQDGLITHDDIFLYTTRPWLMLLISILQRLYSVPIIRLGLLCKLLTYFPVISYQF